MSTKLTLIWLTFICIGPSPVEILLAQTFPPNDRPSPRYVDSNPARSTNKGSPQSRRHVGIEQIHDEEFTSPTAIDNLKVAGLGDSPTAELVRQSQSSAACSNAFKDWKQEDVKRIKNISQLTSKALAFARTCLKPLEANKEYEDLLPFITLLVANDFTENYRHHCVATRVAKSLFLTARHCVFEEILALDEVREWFPLRSDQIVLYLASAPSKPIKLKQIIHPTAVKEHANRFDSSKDQYDYVLLSTQDHLPEMPKKGLNTGAAKLAERLLLVGFYPMVLSATARAMLPTGWLKGVWIDDRPLCHVNAINNVGCLYHGCQTEHGTSGAPLFDSIDRTIVGIHTRQMKEQAVGDCFNSEAKTMPNSGITLPEDLKSTIKERGM